MTVMFPLLNTEPETTVRQLVDDFMVDLERISDPAGPGPDVPLGLPAGHPLTTVGDGDGPEGAADFARDHEAGLLRLDLLGHRSPQALRHIALTCLTALQQKCCPNVSIRWLHKIVGRHPTRWESIMVL